MTSQNIIEFLDAAHLTQHVDHPLPHRGGIMLVGPPESLKTSLLDRAFRPYNDALLISDLNARQLGDIKGDITNGRLHTLAFREFSKLFERDPRTSSHLLGNIRALADEGFKPTFSDPRSSSTLARALVVAAMTEDFYGQNFDRWEKSGFMRRFIWIVFQVKNIGKAKEAMLDKRALNLDGIMRKEPLRNIPYDMDLSDKKVVNHLLKEQRGITTTALLLSKIIAVLKWKYKDEPEKITALLNDIQPSLTRNGGVLVL